MKPFLHSEKRYGTAKIKMNRKYTHRNSNRQIPGENHRIWPRQGSNESYGSQLAAAAALHTPSMTQPREIQILAWAIQIPQFHLKRISCLDCDISGCRHRIALAIALLDSLENSMQDRPFVC